MHNGFMIDAHIACVRDGLGGQRAHRQNKLQIKELLAKLAGSAISLALN